MLPHPGRGQATTLKPALPLAPATAALERYAFSPVSEHTGTPQIAIPLLDIQSRQLRVPISLSYHAAGVRVTDDAPWTGLGWSLNAGGVITRSMRGRPDEEPDGFLANGGTIPSPQSVNEANVEYLKSIADGYRDFEPDLFSYNLGGSTGQFMFDKDGMAHTIPYAPVRITSNFSNATGGFFEITNPAGERYFFDQTEQSSVDLKGQNTPDYTSSWYLSRIVSADQTDTIYFDYTAYTLVAGATQSQQQSMLISKTKDQPDPLLPTIGVPDPLITTTSAVRTQARRLRRIRFATGAVVLKADSTTTTGRQDLRMDARLTAVILYRKRPDRSLQEVRRFTFTHSYFTTGAASEPTTWRLRLDAVTESGGGSSKPPHRFEYATATLPLKTSFARDHWGYYNGRTANADLLPTQEVSTVYGMRTIGRADRRPDPASAQAGLLRKIVYPTGGHTTYEFEGNTIAERYEVPRVLFRHEQRVQGGADEIGRKVEQVTITTPSVEGTLVLSVSRGAPTETTIPHHATGFAECYEIRAGVRTRVAYLPPGPASTSSFASLTFALRLQTGATYEFVTQSGDYSVLVTAKLEWSDGSPPTYAFRNTPAGGLRVKQTTLVPTAPAPPLIKRYEYDQLEQPGRSSGYWTSLPPTYSYQHPVAVGLLFTPEGFPAPECVIQAAAGTKIVVTSAPIGQLSAQSQPIGYSAVTVYEGEAGQATGKTVSRYSAEQDFGSNDKPFPPPSSNAWQRGQLLDQWLYASEPNVYNAYRLLQHTRNQYSLDPAKALAIRGFKVGTGTEYQGERCQPENPIYYEGLYAFTSTYQFSQWQHLDSTIVTRYPATGNGPAWVSRTGYRYENPAHAQPTQSTTVTGAGQALITRYRYPLDYTSTGLLQGPAQGVAELVDRGVVTALIEQQQWRQRATGELVLVEGALTEYDALRPRRVLTVETPIPVPSSAFQSSAILNGTLRQDARYREQQVVDAYDAWGNIAQQHRPGEPTTAYLWGYHGAQLVATIEHATIAEVRQHLQAMGITLATLETDAQHRDAMARLRQRLPQARVTSFTHLPLVGMSSQTDASGRTSFYEYDALGRLLRVRDEQGRILSQQEYQYAAQP
ncbi:RHS repeat domain-containing protein [Hymenobacter sp. HDW8]|uniref:RHS repeat domain-containing protein n=1 Tax=Hymenobacter sp. HDW8 TaxID=2714932 RepID=UPI00140C5118|nr:RHS repeat domain-containing protein [Hymenobacter sp. HDW8]QIL78374.1 RHS repeat protein [Hymenobacter sp. HDW8]